MPVERHPEDDVLDRLASRGTVQRGAGKPGAYPPVKPKRREGGLDGKDLRRVVERLDGDWAAYSIVEATEPLVRRAGILAEHHGSRGYGAVHLAAAFEIARAGGEVSFACFDERLRRAAQREKLRAPRLAS